MDTSSLYQLFIVSSGVTTDSRNCPTGSIFFALKGDSFNGNAYAAQALERGCAYAVIDDKSYYKDNGKYILVDDTLKALQQLAAYHRRKLKTRIIGITGTNGKTTTKELIAAVLQKSFNVLYTLGNLNNHIGVPLTLLRLTPEHDTAVIEMGASHIGEIAELAEITDPDFGIITNVGKAHLEGFGSFEGVITAKGELYEYLRRKRDAIVFINHDNELLMNMAHGLERISYGTGNNLYINGRINGNSHYLELEWKAGESKVVNHVVTRLIGNYNFTNALAAITIGYYFGITRENINKAIGEYQPQNNRSQLKLTDYNALIVDAYNANPTSMQASVENFINMKALSKMVILGDMKELGEDTKAEHQKIIDLLESSPLTDVILIGENFAAVNRRYRSFMNVDEYIDEINTNRPIGKSILIKGSNSIRLDKVIDLL